MTRKNGIKIGLALGGGGARGLAHIGILKVLEREGIPVEVVTGTSMGGMIGAAYAAGISSADIEKEAIRWCKPKALVKLIDPGFMHGAILKGGRIYRYLGEIFGPDRTFDTLTRRLALVATDINSGCEVVLQEGPLVDAIRATISIPGIFIPVKQGVLRLADGGILNNVPADVAYRMGADVVIAVDVLPDFSLNTPGGPIFTYPVSPPKVPRPLKELWHIEIMMISEVTRLRLQAVRPDVLIRPNLPPDMDVILGFQKLKMAMEAGVQAAECALPRLQALLESQPMDPTVQDPSAGDREVC